MSEILDFLVDNDMKVQRNIFLGEQFFPSPITFSQLALLYSRYESGISFINFLYKYECSYVRFFGVELQLEIPNLFYQETPTKEDVIDRNEIEKINTSLGQGISIWPEESIHNFNLFIDVYPPYISILENRNLPVLRKIRQKYIQILASLSDQNEKIATPHSGNNSSLYNQYITPSTAVIQHVQKHPSLCKYAKLAHEYMVRDVFSDEFVDALYSIDTVEARSRATSYCVADSADKPTNWYGMNLCNEVTVEAVPPKTHKHGIKRMKDWLDLFVNTPRLHIITRSIEPLIAALRYIHRTGGRPLRCTIEFSDQEMSIQTDELYGHIMDDMPGLDDDTKFLSYILLLLIGSSSGIPLYASRCWNVVYAVWNQISYANDPVWLARKINANRVEINEKILLELIIRVLTIAHVSDDINDPVKSFKPGNLAYTQYAEAYYERMKNKLGYVQTKGATPPVTSPPSTATSQGRNTAGAIGVGANKEQEPDALPAWPSSLFACRMRFREEFSFPANIDELRSTIQCRLCQFLHYPDMRLAISGIVFI